MVARSPAAKEQRKMTMMPPLNPNLIRETVNKVDKCMARLQELQHTVNGGGAKLITSATVNLSPRTNRSRLGTSLRCKHESSSRIKNGNSRRSPTGKLPTNTEEWRRMSLPAMLLGETMGEIIQATQFAKKIVDATTTRIDDPKTPLTKHNKQVQNSQPHAPPIKRDQNKHMNTVRSESSTQQRAKSQINFKVSSPVVVHKAREHVDKENWYSSKYAANRVSPRNRPWATKTVLFPNPLYHSTSPPKFSNGITKPHKFLIKSPPVKLKKPVSISPPKKSPKVKKPFSPSRFASKFVSPMRNSSKNVRQSSLTSSALRRSFSPSRLASRFVSPLKSRTTKNEGGLKKHPSSSSSSFSARFSPRRI